VLFVVLLPSLRGEFIRPGSNPNHPIFIIAAVLWGGVAGINWRELANRKKTERISAKPLDFFPQI
jgi:hypothetical protein